MLSDYRSILFMHLSANICGICGSKKLCCRIFAEFFYELICEYLRDVRQLKIKLSDYCRVFLRPNLRISAGSAGLKNIAVDYHSFLFMHLSAKICVICGSKK